MATYAPDAAAPAEGRLDDRVFAACALSCGAGVLGAMAGLDHVALALVQVAWGVALYRRAGRRLLLGGALLNATAAAVWIVRTKHADGLESVATIDEIAVVAVALWALRPRRTTRLARAGRVLAMGAAVYLVLLSAVALASGSSERGVAKPLVGVPRAGLQLLCHSG